MRKNDFIISLIIGEAAALMLIFIIKNLSSENAVIAGISPYSYCLLIVFPIFCALWLFIMFLLSKKAAVFFQIGKFTLVGGFNFLLDMMILNILIFTTGIAAGAWQTVFKASSFFIAVISSFLLNKRWVFQNENKKAPKEFILFVTISLIGLVLNLIIDYILVNLVNPFGGMPPKTWAQVSAILAAALIMFWNFIGCKFIVFRDTNISAAADE